MLRFLRVFTPNRFKKILILRGLLVFKTLLYVGCVSVFYANTFAAPCKLSIELLYDAISQTEWAHLSVTQQNTAKDYVRASNAFLQVFEKVKAGKSVSAAKKREVSSQLATQRERFLQTMGVPYRAVHTKFGRKLIIKPSTTTPLGRFAKSLDRNFKTKAVFYPPAQSLKEIFLAAYTPYNRELILSPAALADGRRIKSKTIITSILKPTSVEVHEARHLKLDNDLDFQKSNKFQGSVFPNLKTSALGGYGDFAHFSELSTYPLETHVFFRPLRQLVKKISRDEQLTSLERQKAASFLKYAQEQSDVLTGRVGELTSGMHKILDLTQRHLNNVQWVKTTGARYDENRKLTLENDIYTITLDGTYSNHLTKETIYEIAIKVDGKDIVLDLATPEMKSLAQEALSKNTTPWRRRDIVIHLVETVALPRVSEAARIAKLQEDLSYQMQQIAGQALSVLESPRWDARASDAAIRKLNELIDTLERFAQSAH